MQQILLLPLYLFIAVCTAECVLAFERLLFTHCGQLQSCATIW